MRTWRVVATPGSLNAGYRKFVWQQAFEKYLTFVNFISERTECKET